MDARIEPTSWANDAKLQVNYLGFAAGSIPGASTNVEEMSPPPSRAARSADALATLRYAACQIDRTGLIVLR